MNQKNDLSRITIDLPKEDHKKFKAMAAVIGKSMKDLVVEFIQKHIEINTVSIPTIKTKNSDEQ